MRISTLKPASTRGEIQVGFRALDPYREHRAIDYANFKGRHYGVRAGLSMRQDRQPSNPTQQMVKTLVTLTAMNAPLSDVTPLRADLEFESRVREQVFDREAQRMRLDEVYQDATTEALISGIAFTLNGIKSGGQTYASGNRTLDMGQETTDLLDLDDVSMDASCKAWGKKRFFAYRYTIAVDDAMAAVDEGCYGAAPEDYEDGLLPNENIATPEEARQILGACTRLESQSRRSERVDNNDGEWSAGFGTDRIDETICLWDVVLYMHGKIWIVTLPAEPGQQEVTSIPAGIDKFLACYQWKGPPSGPINCLTFIRVPFNKMPLSLAQTQRDLAEVLDLLANKTFRQLIQTRNLVIYQGQAESTAMAMKSAQQGSYIKGDPASVKNIQTGGMIPDMMPGTQYFQDQWQNATGNLALAAGTGDTGKTATAFEGLMSRVQSFLDFLRTRVEQLATDDLNIRSWYLTNNPVWQRTFNQTVGQAPAAVTASITVANPGSPMAQPGPNGEAPQADYVMQGQHEDFTHRTRAFSMAYANPVISAKQYIEAITTVVPVIMQLMQGGFNGTGAMAILARKLNEPEIANLLPDPVTMALQQQQAQLEEQMAMDPAGDGSNQDYSQNAGPNGRRLPAGQRMQGRAMNPGPGTGSPRPTGGMSMRPPSSAAA